LFKLWKWIFHAFQSEEPSQPTGVLDLTGVVQGGFQKNMRPDEVPHMWRAVRMHGGGAITSPYEMQEWEALIWMSQMKTEIIYIDREVGIIFYR
jgi:hypothetical protein